MYLLNILYAKSTGNWFDIFFDQSTGNFQWASIAAIVAFIAALINIFNGYKTNKSNFKANIVAKSRIEWIQEVRKKSVDFMSACYNLFDYIEAHGDGILYSEEREKEFIGLKNEIEKNGTLLILYFGPNVDGNKNNDLIVYLISSLLRSIKDKDINNDLYSLTELDDKVLVLGDFLRIYFKAEWKRSNGEIKDSEIQWYLEQQGLYVKIMGIFEDEIENEKERVEAKYRLVEEKYRTKTS
ncbi:hypothetical protein [Bacillus cereus group sp. BfR-BA-01356]|uniref:hypothetical protein n=1 Tax=Bacillus cereus group sp. BfR-BA-01356 TaxID=2920319 RepID=UPI001F55C0DB